jgi:hypothetical protein
MKFSEIPVNIPLGISAKGQATTRYVYRITGYLRAPCHEFLIFAGYFVAKNVFNYIDVSLHSKNSFRMMGYDGWGSYDRGLRWGYDMVNTV